MTKPQKAIVIDGEVKMRPILLLDDTTCSRHLLMGVFRGMGMKKVVQCDNERDARQLLESHKFAVLFCNLSGPSQRMADFIKGLRKLPCRDMSEVPIVVTQSRATMLDIALLRDGGSNEVLVPPITPIAVEAKLKRVFFGARETVRADTYIGPDRRWRGSTWTGEDRREPSDPERPTTIDTPLHGHSQQNHQRATDGSAIPN